MRTTRINVATVVHFMTLETYHRSTLKSTSLGTNREIEKQEGSLNSHSLVGYFYDVETGHTVRDVENVYFSYTEALVRVNRLFTKGSFFGICLPDGDSLQFSVLNPPALRAELVHTVDGCTRYCDVTTPIAEHLLHSAYVGTNIVEVVTPYRIVWNTYRWREPESP